MPRPRKQIELGKEYGWLTVLSEAPKDSTGHIRWNVRCRCGNAHVVQTGFLAKPNCKCRKCSDKHDRPQRRLSAVGDVLNGWRLLDEVGKNPQGALLYRCECIYCGHTAIKTRGAISLVKGTGCANCKPDYHFVIHGDSATGTLPDGTEFQIDTTLVSVVQEYHWKKNDKGYITRSNYGMPKLHLHWLALGYQRTPDYIIDHISRDKTDCRSSNLRLVSPQQNAMNRSMGRNCTTGYVGVSYMKRRNRYQAKIGLNCRDIFLGTSRDPIVCAQMYNIASQILFGEYRGHQNDVPPATIELQERIQNKCRQYMAASLMAQMPCTMCESA